MDIIQIIRSHQIQANAETLSLKHRIYIMAVLVSFITMLLPHLSYAEPIHSPNQNQLVFDLFDQSYMDYIVGKSLEISDQNYQDLTQDEMIRRHQLAEAVGQYLTDANSPLAEYASTLVTMRNWKKIIALSNAESSMCKNYIISKANCWGVGGSNLWDFGDNLGQGVVGMNHFLNTYPLNSEIKYAKMSFADMNGLYKKPANDHWLWNNQSVYDDLVSLENNL